MVQAQQQERVQLDAGGAGAGGDGDSEFRLNFGRAVRALEDDLPHALERGFQESVFHPNIQLDAAWLHLSGWRSYSSAHAAVRALAGLLFSDGDFELMRLWSPQPGLLRARCRLVGTPRGSGLLLQLVHPLENLRNMLNSNSSNVISSSTDSRVDSVTGRQPSSGASRPAARKYHAIEWQRELLFTFKFSSKGLIAHHIVERLTPIDPTPAKGLARQGVPAVMRVTPPSAIQSDACMADVPPASRQV